MVPVLMILSDL